MIKFLRCRGFNVNYPKRNVGEDAGFDFYIPFYNLQFKTRFIIDNAKNNSKLVFNEETQKWEIVIPQNDNVIIESGIKCRFNKDLILQGCNKSGIVTKYSLMVGACVVDSSYEGNIKIHLLNVGNKEQRIELGTKIIQLVPVKIDINEYEVLDENNINVKEFYEGHNSMRGEGRFGSTGIN